MNRNSDGFLTEDEVVGTTVSMPLSLLSTKRVQEPHQLSSSQGDIGIRLRSDTSR